MAVGHLQGWRRSYHETTVHRRRDGPGSRRMRPFALGSPEGTAGRAIPSARWGCNRSRRSTTAINRGTGNAAMAQSGLGDPNDPRWSGRAPAPSPDPNRPGRLRRPDARRRRQQPAQMAAAAPADVPPNWSREPGHDVARSSVRGIPAGSGGSSRGRAYRPQPANRRPRRPSRPAPPSGLNPTPRLDVAAAAAAAALPAGAAAWPAIRRPPAGRHRTRQHCRLRRRRVCAGPGTDAQAGAACRVDPVDARAAGRPDARDAGSSGRVAGTGFQHAGRRSGRRRRRCRCLARCACGLPDRTVRRMTGPSVNGLQPVGAAARLARPAPQRPRPTPRSALRRAERSSQRSRDPWRAAAPAIRSWARIPT